MNNKSARAVVIMCVKNGARYLQQAIDSILHQTWQDFLFIIIDDQSTDQTPEILVRQSDSRIKVVKYPISGFTACLNRAIFSTDHEYILRMDADDISLPQRFAEQINFMDQNPQYGAVGCWYDVINDCGTVTTTYRPELTCAELKRSLLFKAVIPHSTAIIRRKAFTEVGGYDESYICAQDRDLWLRLIKNWKIGVVPINLFQLRIHTESVSVKKEIEQKIACIRAIDSAIDRGVYSHSTRLITYSKKLLLNLPQPLQRFKNRLLTRVGMRLSNGKS